MLKKSFSRLCERSKAISLLKLGINSTISVLKYQ
jgi:hypothetical protein